jgi:2-amino-4-hydroxy-6-hydroxymethyldihydropteridine diphosphokinase
MRVYVGTGSNLGDRWQSFAFAIQKLAQEPGVEVLRASRVYDTEPVGPPQPRFLNAVLELETEVPPEELLTRMQRIEDASGRKRDSRWAARTLDLDLLLYGDLVLTSPTLSVPHPAMTARRFVLAPLAELCPEQIVPGTGSTVVQLLASAPPLHIVVAGLYPK